MFRNLDGICALYIRTLPLDGFYVTLHVAASYPDRIIIKFRFIERYFFAQLWKFDVTKMTRGRERFVGK